MLIWYGSNRATCRARIAEKAIKTVATTIAEAEATYGWVDAIAEVILAVAPSSKFCTGASRLRKEVLVSEAGWVWHGLSQPWPQVPSFTLLSDIPPHFGIDDIGRHFPLKQVVRDVAAA